MNTPSAGAQHHHQRQKPKMLLGKRPRPPPNMRRTTSMGGISLAVDEADRELASDDPHQQVLLPHDPPYPHDVPRDPPPMTMNVVTGFKGFDQYDDERLVMSPSSSSSSTTTTNFSPMHVMPTPHFLRTCGLCSRGLAPGRDIYMYRGDTAFCSLECREKQMRQDEKKEKRKVASNKHVHTASSPTASSDDPT